MTCRYSNTDWLDVLYNSVRRTSGGVSDAARFLTERRGRNIHPESLRAKLRAVNGDEISLSMADLLTEWMEEKAGGAAYARDWMLAHAAQNGLTVDYVPSYEAGDPRSDAAALRDKFLDVSKRIGTIAGVTLEATADDVISPAEADRLVPHLRDARVILHCMERNALRAAKGA